MNIEVVNKTIAVVNHINGYCISLDVLVKSRIPVSVEIKLSYEGRGKKIRQDFSVKKLSSTTADALKILQVDNSSIFKEVTVQCHDLIQNTKEKMENEHNEKVKKY